MTPFTLQDGLVALGFAVFCSIMRPAAASLPDAKIIDAVLDPYFNQTLKAEEAPGAVVAIVDRSGDVFLHGYGYADGARTIPMDPQRHLFRLASQTKLFTSIAVMQLHELGLIDLNADANRYLHATKIPDGFGAAVTIRDLMQHTSGVADSYYRMLLKDPSLHQPLSSWFQQHGIQRIRKPGLVLDYNNRDFAILGLVIEGVSGETYEDYIQNHILTPLGMTSTTFILDSGTRINMAEGTFRSSGHLITAIVPDSLERPAGDLISSARDMSRFLVMLLNDGEFEGQRLMSAESARAMRDDCFIADAGLAWCLGLARIANSRGPMLRHPGGYYTYRSSVWLFPNAGIAVFVAINSSADMTESFIRRVAPVLVGFDPMRAAIAPPHQGSGAERFAGAYRREVLNRSIDKLSYLLIGDTQFASCSQTSLCVGPDVFVQIGANAFQDPSNAVVISFSIDPLRHIQYATIGEFTYARVPLWARTTTHRWLILAALILMALAIPAITASATEIRGSKWLRNAWLTMGLAPTVLWIMSVVIMTAWAYTTSELSVLWDFDWGLPGHLKAALWAVRIACLLSVAWAAAILWFIWRQRPSAIICWRLWSSGASTLTLSLLAVYWNLFY